MDTSQDNIVSALKSIRALVGSLAFEAAVATLNGEAVAVAAEVAPAVVPEEKPKRTRRLTDEQRDAAKSNMAAMQAFIKAKRAALPEGTPHKEVQRQAGEEWKGKTKEEKEAWYKAHLEGSSAAPEVAAAEAPVGAPTTKVTKVTTPLGPAPRGAKRSVGRPPKDAPPTGRLNVRRLSKTETEEAPLPGAAE